MSFQPSHSGGTPDHFFESDSSRPFDHAMPSSSSNSALAGLSAIAQAMSVKNATLQSEREHYETEMIRLAALKEKRKREQERNDDIKYKLLQESKRAAEVEIRWMDDQQKRKKLRSDTHSYDENIEELMQDLSALREECKRDAEHLYAPHLNTTTLYHRTLENELARIQECKRKREFEINALRTEHRQNLTDIQNTEKEMRKMKSLMEVMAQAESGEDEEIAGLAMQIRATLAKRVSLRGALGDAKERNRAANEETVKWETKLMNLSHVR
mmetsp:Transcript_11581/g.17602  ORF Transcript_11581/g.17602 Transcript_11581/m.17602 type:complete len:270 (+) Transcript_11581:44-853(+)